MEMLAGERDLWMSQSVSCSSQVGATPLGSGNEEFKRELAFFSHKERISMRRAGKSSQVRGERTEESAM